VVVAKKRSPILSALAVLGGRSKDKVTTFPKSKLDRSIPFEERADRFQRGEIEQGELDRQFKQILGGSFDKSKVKFAWVANVLINEFRRRES